MPTRKPTTDRTMKALRVDDKPLTLTMPHMDADVAEQLADKAVPLFVLRATPDGEALSANDRQELLAKLRAGEFAGPLVVEATTYVQRATPNRNFVRFKSGSLRAGARSFRNMPVLLDHDQRSVSSRVGTIVDSRAEVVDGDTAFVQTLSFVKLDAIEGVLDGTIDRFSIGWMPTGTIECSVHKGPMFGPDCCSCWPGDNVDGKVAEAVFTSWEGIEVSAVNVPAVVGTGIDQVRAALTALRASNGGSSPQNNEDKIMDEIKALLGLPPTATEDEVKAALAAQKAKADEAAAAIVLAAQHETAARATRLDSMIEAAYADGRLTVERDSKGARIASALETRVRSVAAADIELAASLLEAMPKRQPGGTPGELQSSKPAAPVVAPKLTDANPHLGPMLSVFGLDEEDVEKYGPKNRLGYDHKTQPVPRHLSKVFAQRYPTNSRA